MSFIANGGDRPVLPALQELLAGADEALLCLAFVDVRGVLLVGKELRGLGSRGRVVATTTFSEGRALAALDEARAGGTRCRVLNPARGTFHPKVVVARHGSVTRALVGSANLTSGLVSNVEAGILTTDDTGEISRAAERWWADGIDLSAVQGARVQDTFEPDLWSALRGALRAGDTVSTLSSGNVNRIVAIERTGLYVETDRSLKLGSGPQFIEARMLQVAWDALKAEGELTNSRLLNELRVHRSSFVCAALAILPQVAVLCRRPIRLGWVGSQHMSVAAEATPQYEP